VTRDSTGELRSAGSASVVTIDGPAGSGKSTTAREVARRLGMRHLDSGSLYRAVTLALLKSVEGDELPDVSDPELLRSLDIRIVPEDHGFMVLLDGVHPGEDLRSPEVTSAVPRLAGSPLVRRRLLDLQRSTLSGSGVVADGRDMGTVVFPDARLKVFLTASIEERARRRLVQEGRDAASQEVKAEAERLLERDGRDSGRKVAPLRQAEGALVLDTTELSFEGQVERIVKAYRELTGSTPGE